MDALYMILFVTDCHDLVLKLLSESRLLLLALKVCQDMCSKEHCIAMPINRIHGVTLMGKAIALLRLHKEFVAY